MYALIRKCAFLALFMFLAAGFACAQAEENGPVYDLLITEALSNNDTEWALEFQDYVEIYNGSDATVQLADYFLTRDEDEPFDCRLPAMELAPDSYTVLVSEIDLPDLRLPKGGCELYLYHQDGTLCDEVELPAMEKQVWQRENGLTLLASPGHPNTEVGAEQWRAQLDYSLVINEVVSSNSQWMPLNGEYYDLIELTNVTGETLLLSDYYLSDKKTDPLRWQLPARELAPGECYVVYASDGEGKDEAPFKVSADGEALFVNNQYGRCIDALYVPELFANTSYGRYENKLCYFETPTIGKPNTEGNSGVTQMPRASLPTGTFSEAQQVMLSGEGRIYYTLDGKTPDESSMLYDGTPIEVAASTVLRVRALDENKLWSQTRTYTYLYDTEKYELPLLCVSAEPDALFGPKGVYTQYEKRSLEAPINLTLIEDGQEQFTIDCGLKIHGQGSRTLKKKSFQVRFRSRYGAGKLEYKLFDESPITSFNGLVLRCGSEDSNRAFFRDEFLSSLTAETMPEVLYQMYRPVNLFVDGEYYGLYYIRERLDDEYVASHLGGVAEDVDMVRGWSGQEHGSAEDFRELLKYCRNHDMSKQENFDHVASQLSLEGFMDYYIARAYSGDRDYPNIRHVRSHGGDGLWRIINFDLDWGFGTQPAGFTQMIGEVRDGSSLNTVIINALLKNPDFRDQMLTRLAWHLRNTYAPERVWAHLDKLTAEVEHDLQYNYEIWNGTYEGWKEHVQFLRDFVKSDEKDRVADLVRNARYAFRISEEEMVHYFGDLYTPQQ